MRYRLDVTYENNAPQSIIVRGTERQADAVASAMASSGGVVDVGVYEMQDDGREDCTGFYRGPLHPYHR